ncbi:MAG: hypothetical protein LBN93_11355 [Candidatus Symbiothrix sp.]|jgi:hypothetical protein|nr:hypothetical protein [Candidatus Symbiothrix sp.]
MKKRILFRELRVSTTLDRTSIKSAMTVALAIACVLVTGNCSLATAQVAIGGDGTVTPGALLDLSQATDAGGLLLPQIVSADTLTAVLRKPGMLVYNKTDGKIYAYNGSAWSAGGSSGGGGGSEPEPTPSPTSCSGSVMGVSGNLYPIGSYPYAQNDLKNLCWTLTNLKEAGASYTSYNGKSEVRGYYYGNSITLDSQEDFCATTLGGGWRVPTTSDWELLIAGAADLDWNEMKNWCCAPAALAGYILNNNGTRWYESWDTKSVYRAALRDDMIVFDPDLVFEGWAYAYWAFAKQSFYGSVRCVKSL